MPKNLDTKMCNAAEFFCWSDAETGFFNRKFKDGFQLTSKQKENSTCDCLPSCTTIDYEETVTQSDFNSFLLKEIFDKEANQDEIWTGIHVYFIEPTIHASYRSERYGLIEFLASCGGVLGNFEIHTVSSKTSLNKELISTILLTKSTKNKSVFVLLLTLIKNFFYRFRSFHGYFCAIND